MMKILFLVYHGFSEHSGISKKIHYQVKGLRENGYDVRLCYYDFSAEGHRCRFVDGKVLADYGTGWLAGLRQRFSYDSLFDYCVREGIRLVYARCFQNANPWLTRFFCRLRGAGIHAVTEIPTYPYDEEFRSFAFKQRMELRVDQLFRRRLYRQMDAVVTFSDAREIFGQQTINISNGVDFDSVPLHHGPAFSAGSALHLIGVAEVHPWHAFDRVMTGMGEYYRSSKSKVQSSKSEFQTSNFKPQTSKSEFQTSNFKLQTSNFSEVFFHVVGGVHPHHMEHVFRPILDRYQLHDRVVFHGQLFGRQLDDVFDQCQFAIGSLGRHRSGITVIKTLKNREYASRGIPFVYSEQDSDFDDAPYVLKASADESPLDIRGIIDFLSRFSVPPQDIRRSVEHLSWKIQMRRVVDAVIPPGVSDKGIEKESSNLRLGK